MLLDILVTKKLKTYTLSGHGEVAKLLKQQPGTDRALIRFSLDEFKPVACVGFAAPLAVKAEFYQPSPAGPSIICCLEPEPLKVVAKRSSSCKQHTSNLGNNKSARGWSQLFKEGNVSLKDAAGLVKRLPEL